MSTTTFCEKLRASCIHNGFSVADTEAFTRRCQMDLNNRDGLDVDMRPAGMDYIWRFGLDATGRQRVAQLFYTGPGRSPVGTDAIHCAIWSIGDLANKNNCTKYGGTGGGNALSPQPSAIPIRRKPDGDKLKFSVAISGLFATLATLAYQSRHPIGYGVALSLWTLLGVDPPQPDFSQDSTL